MYPGSSNPEFITAVQTGSFVCAIFLSFLVNTPTSKVVLFTTLAYLLYASVTVAVFDEFTYTMLAIEFIAFLSVAAILIREILKE